MKSYNTHDAKTHLSHLLDRAAKGEEIVIARKGKPIAKLVPYVAHELARTPGVLRGAITVAGDFDAPLPGDLARGFGIGAA